MTEKQNAQQTPPKRFFGADTIGSLPIEPVNTVPFINDPQAFRKGLSAPPVEPVNISPFPAKPVQQTNSNKSSSETTK
jgi:hypothetical protein